MSNIPEGWTDDMTIPLPSGQTVEAIGQFVIQREISKSSGEDIVQSLVVKFGISSDDAALVYDRVLGGIVRAATGNVANRPDPAKDPFAYYSFEQARRDRGIIAAIRPEYAQAPELKETQVQPTLNESMTPKRNWISLVFAVAIFLIAISRILHVFALLVSGVAFGAMAVTFSRGIRDGVSRTALLGLVFVAAYTPRFSYWPAGMMAIISLLGGLWELGQILRLKHKHKESFKLDT
jgi:hypothetical protein